MAVALSYVLCEKLREQIKNSKNIHSIIIDKLLNFSSWDKNFFKINSGSDIIDGVHTIILNDNFMISGFIEKPYRSMYFSSEKEKIEDVYVTLFFNKINKFTYNHIGYKYNDDINDWELNTEKQVYDIWIKKL